MNGGIWFAIIVISLSIFVAYAKHREKRIEIKFKLPSWKKITLIGFSIIILWYNWTGIKTFVREIYYERLIDNISFLNKKSKSNILKAELKELEEKARERSLTKEETDLFKETSAKLGMIYESKKQKSSFHPPKRQVIIKTIDLPAGKVVETKLKKFTGDRVEYKKSPQGRKYYFSIINSIGEEIKITSDSSITKEVQNKNGTDKGKIKLEGGPKDLKITIKIIPGYYL